MALRTALSPTTRARTPHDDGRLVFVDGLRGIAAVVVMGGHAIAIAHPETASIRALPALLLRPLLFGGQMVFLFILVSGFALCWSEDHRVLQGRGRTSLRAYLRRRAWRILPTYYVALACGLAVVVLLGRLLLAPASPSMRTYGPVTPDGVIAHLFMAHTLIPSWAHQANPPLWSIAFEVQLYVLFPVVCALIARRVPALIACGLCAAGAKIVGHLAHLPLFGLVDWFFAGVLAARLARAASVPHRLLLTAGTATAVFGVAFVPPSTDGPYAKAFWMIGFVCLVAGLVRARPGGWNLPTRRAAMWIGQRSYSLYAIHFPVLLLVWAGVGRLQLSPQAALAVMLVVGAPASVACAHLLYATVERPALERVRRAGRRGQKVSAPQQ